ncbi:response regulator transcription factor [Paenibacillus glycanilyticus]|uniref:Response regulator n=1 Tax=Paenibacillus glycanilyticus TaxID=126569 RepID=A0ABQ6GEA9_9BACL|nr:response regulator [Paenibacillus glycanilyticus]GLX68585.1 hypothetical protein MU1_29300 [Paenibacillus glycanilyticus]
MIKVLLVEDEPLVRRGIRSMMPLGEYGMELIGEAASGEEALAVLERQPVDLVITDISMPGMNGLELIEVIKERFVHTRSVVLTCHQDFDYLQRALRLGAIDYLVKTQLDDDSAADMLKRVSDMLGMLRKPGIDDHAPEARADFQELSRGWGELFWLVEREGFEMLAARSASALHPEAWNALLLREHEGWLTKCPLLEPLRGSKAGLNGKDTVNGIKEWLVTFREEALMLLRRTMYSEEVIASVVRALDLLNGHTGERMNQAELCKEINMSISYFSKCFKEIVGLPFVTYAQDRNIRHAQQLLQTTNIPVYQVAEQSGFQDEKYFGKIFRLKTGRSPSEYRLLYRE